MRIASLSFAGAVLLAVSVQPAFANQAEDGIERCAAIADSLSRLACFDELARTVQARRGGRDRDPSQATTPVTRPVERQAQFGLDQRQIRAQDPTVEQPIEQITAQVATIQMFGPGYWTLNMADGSVWRTTELVPSFRPPRAGQSVVVRKGVLGGYLLEVGNQTAMRINRIK